jgi:hypothetical protein
MNIAASVKPQIAGLAKKEFAKASVRKDSSSAASSAKSQDSDLFSNLVDNDNDRAAVSSTSTDNLPKSSSPVDKFSPSAPSNDTSPSRQRDEVTETRISKSQTPERSQSQQDDDQKTDAVDKNRALQVFLDQMQSQLGVKPEQVVEAFSKLDISDLAQSPEDTMPKVIGELKLKGKDKEIATDLYSQMLSMSATAKMQDYLKDQKQTANLEVMNPQDVARRETNKNLMAMNESFFALNRQEASASAAVRAQAAYGMQAAKLTAVNNPAAGQANGLTLEAQMNANVANPALADDAAPIEMPKDFGTMTPMGMQLPPVLPPPMSDAEAAALTPEAIAKNPMPAIQALEKELATLEQVSPNDPDLPAMKDALAQLKASIPQAQQTQVAAQMPNPKLDLSAMNAKAGQNAYAASTTAAAGMAAAAKSRGSDDASAGGDNKDQKQDSQQLDGLGQLNQKQQPQTLNSKEFVVNAPKASPAEMQANVKEIMNQARFLATKGGGEMKVKLNPYGLGEVNLKVSSNNGQLNIEMVTSNDDAKKALEKGIGDLKASLAEHKLHIEQIKIDSPKESSNQMTQNSDQGDKQFQHSFLQDFHQQNSDFRREFFDINTATMPGSNTREQASNTNLNPKARASRRLDLVA